MAPEKSPAFQFYPKDFLMDGRVAGMTLTERGAYITLLCLCWQEKSLPNDLGRLANMVGQPLAAFRKLWPALAPCFQSGDDGRLIHRRLEVEREKQEEFRRKQAEKGRASGASRKATGRQPEGNRGSTAVEPDPQPDPQPKPNSPISDLRSPIKEQEHERARASSPAFHEIVMNAFREGWKRTYGHECSLIVSPLQFMQLEQQIGAHGTVLLAALSAFFESTDGYVVKAKHPLALWLRDPLKYLAVAPPVVDADEAEFRRLVAKGPSVRP